jgi:hypothetical protein
VVKFEPIEYRFKDELLQPIDKDADAQGKSEDVPVERLVAHVRTLKNSQPGSRNHNHDDTVNQDDDKCDHENDVGIETLPPRLGYRKGEQSHDVHDICKQE